MEIPTAKPNVAWPEFRENTYGGTENVGAKYRNQSAENDGEGGAGGGAAAQVMVLGFEQGRDLAFLLAPFAHIRGWGDSKNCSRIIESIRRFKEEVSSKETHPMVIVIDNEQIWNHPHN